MKYITYLCSIFLTIESAFGAAPSNQANTFKASNIKPWLFNFTFNAASGGADAYLVVINTNINNDVPVNGKVYKTGQALGANKVAYVGGIKTIEIKPCAAATKYYVKIFAFNNISNPEYNLVNPLFDSVVTAGSNMGNYYGNISPASSSFVSDLTALINNHTFRTYDDYEKILVPTFYERDTVINDTAKKVVQCEYSNEFKIYLPPFDFANNSINYSREHVLPKNWMNKRGIPNGDLIYYPEGADYHNLLLTRTNNVNSTRSDNPYGKVSSITSSYLQCKYGKNTSNVNVFEPKQDIKGNGSRCMMYEMICYNNTLGNWGLSNLGGKAPSQNQDLLKEWHKIDEVDNYEIARHELIYSLQNNRNPFIDHPEWADCIDFSNISSLKCASAIFKDKTMPVDFIVRCTQEGISIKFTATENFEATLVLYNLLGQPLFQKKIFLFIGENHIACSTTNSVDGISLMQLQGKDFTLTQPIKLIAY